MDSEPATGGEGPPEEPTPAGFGWWPSRWSPAMTAAGKVSRSELQADNGSLFWCESRPGDGGGQVVVRSSGGTPVADVSPPGVSVRSRVHEYGGGSATVWGGALFYIDQSDQQWYRIDVAGGPVAAPRSPVPLTGKEAPTAFTDGPTSELPSGWTTRFADGRVTPSGRWLLSVEERYGDGRTDHRLVAVSVAEGSAPVPLVDHRDFVAAPRPSPDGQWMAWVTWDHPFMPWDRSELWVARVQETGGGIRLVDARRVAGGGDRSVGQPHWARDGSLLFVDDRSGWWLPYRLAPVGPDGRWGVPEALVDMEAEFHGPDWVLGQSTMAERSDGSLVCRMHRAGRDQVVLLRPTSASGGSGRRSAATLWSVDVIDQPCVVVSGVVVVTDPGVPGDRLYLLGSTPVESQAVFEIPWTGGGPFRRVSTGPEPPLESAHVSVALPFTASTSDGPIPGLFYEPPARPPGAPTGPPPLVVFCHGGPTSAAGGGLDPVIQFFTSRGLSVAAVNYRGSSGYGRDFRGRLEGHWGEADVDDCVQYASALVQAGMVDGSRMAIRGTSAGGLTALGALIRSDRFAGAAAWYGVTDLEALAADTHDFESHYVDSLIGPWPEAAETYRARSPINGAAQVTGQVLLIQGTDDPVVPLDQSERFAARLIEHGVPCRLILFEGESHGFRQASTIEASLVAELEFYRSLFVDPPQTGPSDPVV
jgi:dipeptidyl aminopeptidase/acylaminoacyl peptidase